jgi:hypothetical protein
VWEEKAMTTAAPRPDYPRPFRWTCELFQKVAELGFFEGRRAMLVDGVIYEEGAESPAHCCARSLVADAFYNAFAGGHLRQRLSLVLGDATHLFPDVCIVPGGIRDYSSAHPTTAMFVVEIADLSLLMDTTTKAGLYAAASIPDYWVLDIVNRQLHVFRDPRLQAETGTSPYRSYLTFGPADSVSPLHAPSATIRVADLLP